MRFVNHAGRMTLLTSDDEGLDVSQSSNGQLPSDPGEALDRWPEVLAWAGQQNGHAGSAIDWASVGAPSPRPRQALGVGLNYASHADEAGFEIPDTPLIFTKLQAALVGPYDDVPLSSATVDWEVELVVVMGREARNVDAAQAWDYIAGFTLGQDYSDREVQNRPTRDPQVTLGKSRPGFGPTGPTLATLDEFADRDDVELTCRLNGDEVQRGRTSDLIFTVTDLVAYLSEVTRLYPGDVIFTGTPPGVGATRQPPQFLAPTDVVESWAAEIGTMRQVLVADTGL